MQRRDFLRFLGLGATSAVASSLLGAELDLERLLWVPKPMIVVPGRCVSMTEIDEVLKRIYLPVVREYLSGGPGTYLNSLLRDVDPIPFVRREPIALLYRGTGTGPIARSQ